MQKNINKKAQVTMFVITALVIVVLIIIFFLIRANITNKSDIRKAPESPNQYLSECVSVHIDKASELIIRNGGYISNESYKRYTEYEYERIPYLCFTPDFYSRCITAEPVIMDHLKEDFHSYLSPKIKTCLEELERDLKSDGFTISGTSEESFILEILPNRIEVVINKDIKIEKSGEIKEFSKFRSSSQSSLYDFVRIVQRITEDEAKYTNSEYINIMAADPWMDITKVVTGNSDKIYTLTDTNTGISWRFAVRGGILSTPS